MATATRCSVIAMVLYPKVQSKAPVELTELWAIRGISARTLWTQMRETHGSPCSASEDGDYPHPYRLCSTPNSGHDSMCPGRLLTDSSIFLAIVHLLFVFDILPPKGCDSQRLLHPTACRDCEVRTLCTSYVCRRSDAQRYDTPQAPQAIQVQSCAAILLGT